MASALTKYLIVRDWVEEAIKDTSGFENVNVVYGDTVSKIDVPSAFIKLNDCDITLDGTPYLSVLEILVGFKVLYEDEDIFLPKLDLLITAINQAGTACGVEFMYVSGVSISAENKEYSKATLRIEIRTYTD
jgi:hypothetical protein